LKKNFFKIGRAGYQKKGNLHWFQKCAEVLSLAKGKKIFTEKLNFLGLGKFRTKLFFWEKIFAKNCFSEKNLWELLDARVLHIFEISAKFRFF
jgi:hypothetical protein